VKDLLKDAAMFGHAHQKPWMDFEKKQPAMGHRVSIVQSMQRPRNAIKRD
jgi:hypothetical protein